jgi:hypothetical protein
MLLTAAITVRKMKIVIITDQTGSRRYFRISIKQLKHHVFKAAGFAGQSIKWLTPKVLIFGLLGCPYTVPLAVLPGCAFFGLRDLRLRFKNSTKVLMDFVRSDNFIFYASGLDAHRLSY